MIIGSIIILHLSLLWKATFFILCDVIFWWGCRGNLKLIGPCASERVYAAGRKVPQMHLTLTSVKWPIIKFSNLFLTLVPSFGWSLESYFIFSGMSDWETIDWCLFSSILPGDFLLHIPVDRRTPDVLRRRCRLIVVGGLHSRVLRLGNIFLVLPTILMEEFSNLNSLKAVFQ